MTPTSPDASSSAFSAGVMQKPGMRPVPCPLDPYCLPVSEPVHTNSVWLVTPSAAPGNCVVSL